MHNCSLSLRIIVRVGLDSWMAIVYRQLNNALTLLPRILASVSYWLLHHFRKWTRQAPSQMMYATTHCILPQRNGWECFPNAVDMSINRHSDKSWWEEPGTWNQKRGEKMGQSSSAVWLLAIILLLWAPVFTLVNLRYLNSAVWVAVVKLSSRNVGESTLQTIKNRYIRKILGDMIEENFQLRYTFFGITVMAYCVHFIWVFSYNHFWGLILPPLPQFLNTSWTLYIT